MNLLMDSLQHSQPPSHASPNRRTPPQHAELRISTTPPNAMSGATHQPNHNHNHILNHSHNHNNNNNNNNNETPASPVASGKTTLKRSFDVAFLMMPDERIKQKQAEKQARLHEALQHHHQQQQQQQQLAQYPTDLSPRAAAASQPASPAAAEYISLLEARQRYPQLSIRSPRIYDDPTVVIPLADSPESAVASPQRSAFTKVASSLSTSSSTTSSSTASRLESPVELGAPPLSPDQLSCHSISPPLATPPPRTNSGGGGGGPNLQLPPHIGQHSIVYHSFRPEYQFNGAFQAVNPMQALQAQRLKQQLLYRPVNAQALSNGPTNQGMGPGGGPSPEFLHAAYPGFGHPQPHHFAAAQPELPRIVQNPAAAAILSTLIPPTLASTFTLTAQNVCAKCNISFRMTSDLVYHMRSHHKSEVACDPNRRKREEKLRCPVCQETFRERHHLTRHMTAHQDKASDHQPADDSADGEIIHVGGGGGSPNAQRRPPPLSK